ncbi:MAG: ParA family protein, partial [Nitrospiria bacterium]
MAKTTTSINLAASLAVAEKRVLLIDLDPQGNTTRGLGYNSDEITGSVYDLFSGRRAISDLTIQTGIPKLDLLPSHIDL